MTQANQTQAPDFVALLQKRAKKSDAPIRDMLGDVAHTISCAVNVVGEIAKGLDREIFTINTVREYECADTLDEAWYANQEKKQDRRLRANAKAIQIAQQMASLKAMNSQVEVSAEAFA